MWIRRLSGCFALALFLSAAPSARASTLVNGDFETGDLTGWTTFNDGNSNAGPGYPIVTSFDTTGSGASNAVEFAVGRNDFITPPGRSGILQSFVAGAGNYALKADVAFLGGDADNADGGTAFLIFDNVVVDSFATGGLPASPATVRHSFNVVINGVAAGSHEIRIAFSRLYLTNGNTPKQFADNISVEAASVPEPSTILLGAVGAGFGLIRVVRRRRSA